MSGTSASAPKRRWPTFSLRTFLVATLALSLILGYYGRVWFRAGELSPDQQFVVAAFELNVTKVKALLEAGVKPNVRMGDYDGELFTDNWTGGSPMGSHHWTPLLAVANSHREPQPDEPTKMTSAALDNQQRPQRQRKPAAAFEGGHEGQDSIATVSAV